MVEQFVLHFRTGCGNSAKFVRFFDMGFTQKSNAFFFYFLQQATFNDQSFLERADRRDRKLNGSTRSMASTHPMLATSTSAPGMGGHHYLGGQSPVRESFRHHLSAEATSLTSKVHTVILTGKFYNSLIHSR